MAKLTLSVDTTVVVRAKEFAKSEGVSVSELVEQYLAAVAERGPGDSGATPVLQSVRGMLKNADVSEYREHLANKYR